MITTPEEIGLKTLLRTGLGDKVPVDVDELARRLNVEVQYVSAKCLLERIKNDHRCSLDIADVRRRFCAVILPQGGAGRPLALVRSDLPPWKSRMALGHELGHCLSDNEPIQASDCRPALEARFKTTSNAYIRFEQRREELQADRIGRALLMNPQLFKTDVRIHTLTELTKKYQVPLRDVMDYAITLDICPMVRLFGWYEKPKLCVHNFDSFFSPSATVSLRQAFSVLRASFSELAPVIRQWILDQTNPSYAYFEVEGHQFGIAVYNHVRSQRLILLLADIAEVRRHQLHCGLFRQLKDLCSKRL